MADDKDVKEIPIDPEQALREMFYDGNYDETMSFEEFKRRGIANRSKGSPRTGEVAKRSLSRGGRAALQGTKFKGVF
tara:strand:- start:131 stop:361 length:231 start_codon:yes stop_codon:yes gene_type:complete